MFDKKNNDVDFNTEITDENALNEIENIAERLDEGEKVLEVAKQSRCAPQFLQIKWHACNDAISSLHLGHFTCSCTYSVILLCFKIFCKLMSKG